MSRYKAAIFRRGAETENVYGIDPIKVLRRALHKLNTPEPTTPSVRVILYEQGQKTGRNSAIWIERQIVQYEPPKSPPKMRPKSPPEKQVKEKDLALEIIGDLRQMGQALARIEAVLRKNPKLFACANDYLVMNVMKDQVQSGAIAVGHAISWAHTQKYGVLAQPPVPEPPEFQNCPHCQAQLPYTFPEIHCPKCKKRLRPPNAFAELMRQESADIERQGVLGDIDATE